MQAILSVIAVPALFVAPVAAWVAFASFRSGERPMAWKSLAVAVVAGGIYLAAWKPGNYVTRDNCWTDWDGRSNPTVCD